MTVFSGPYFKDHELVAFGSDPASGLQCTVAIHSTRFGQAFGGCRMWDYASDDEALADALRLSRGMTYKAAVAGLSVGGGSPSPMTALGVYMALLAAVEHCMGRTELSGVRASPCRAWVPSAMPCAATWPRPAPV